MLKIKSCLLLFISIFLLVIACGQESTKDNKEIKQSEFSYHKDIAPIISKNCLSCHDGKGIAPFSLNNYEEVKKASKLIKEQVLSGKMPPFLAKDSDQCGTEFTWKQDLRLSKDDISKISSWVDDGSSEGELKKDKASLPKPPSMELDRVDKTVQMKKPWTVKAGDKDDVYRCFTIPFDIKEDKYLTGYQVVPGNAKIVHHVVLFMDRSEQSLKKKLDSHDSYPCFGAPGIEDVYILGGWAPGSQPIETPPDVGFEVKKNYRLIMQLHYFPRGKEESDLTKLQLRFAKKKPAYNSFIVPFGGALKGQTIGLSKGKGDRGSKAEFWIPSGEKSHIEQYKQIIPPLGSFTGIKIWSVFPHMHLAGSDIKLDLRKYNEDKKKCVMHVPEWDFSWQRNYVFDLPNDKLPGLDPGDINYLRCTYNNSLQNKALALALKSKGLDKPKDISLGEETLDEMCLLFAGVMLKN